MIRAPDTRWQIRRIALGAADIREQEVHHDHRRPQGEVGVDAFAAGAHVTHDLQVGFRRNDSPQAIANNGVIVNNQDRDCI